jgi:poly(beta-D-mannuronate) C5 epimerase
LNSKAARRFALIAGTLAGCLGQAQIVAAQQMPAIAVPAPVDDGGGAQPAAPTLAELQVLLEKAKAETDPAARHAAQAEAMLFFDKLSLSGADAHGKFDGAEFLTETASQFLDYAATLPGGSDAQEKVLTEARDLLPRIRDVTRQAEFYIALAHIEMAAGDQVDGMAAIRKAGGLVVTLQPGPARDRVRVALVRLALPLTSIDVGIKFGWSVAIDDPKLARNAMRAVAMAEIAGHRAGRQPFQLAAKDGAERAASLAGYAVGQLSGGNLHRALIAALAIGDEHAGERDEALTRLLARQVERGARPEEILAPYAIADAGMREAALVRLSGYSIDRGRLAVARGLVRHLDSPQARFDALAAIANRLIREEYTLDWAATWDQAADAAGHIGVAPARSEAFRRLGVEAADAGDIDRAERALGQTGRGPAGEMISQHIALAAIADQKVDEAVELFNRLEAAPGRGEVAAALYAALLSIGRPDRAAPLPAAIDMPADRVTMLMADAARFGNDPAAPEYDPAKSAALLTRAKTELARIADAPLRDRRIGDVAKVLSQRGDVDGVKSVLALASPAGQVSMAPMQVGAQARAKDARSALAVLDGLPPQARDGGLSEIAAVLAERGDTIAAYDTARLIASDHVRRRALRRTAEMQARLQRLRDRDSMTMAAPPADRPKAAEISISSDQFVLRAASPGEPRDMPDLLAAAKVTGDDVRHIVPAAKPGNVRLVPTGFSNFDEKFSYIRYLNNVDFNGGEEELLAQGQGTLFPSFILVESGVYDLPTLKAQLEAADVLLQPITNDGRVYQLNVPLLIGSDATLVITSSDVEELRLNTAAHSYIVNSGKLFIVDTKVTSWDPATGQPTPRSKRVWNEFSPFYTAWSGSQTYMADAHINGMGYANGKSYGISISNGPINVLKATLNSVPRPKGTIVDSTFTDMYYAFYSYEADDFRLVGNEYNNNEIYAIDPHDRSTHLTIAYNTTTGTRGKHGIITSREVKDSVIMGNVSADNHGSGFMLDRTSDRNIVAFNLGFRNGADGLTVYESSCNLIYRNTFLENRRDGVKLRNSWNLLVSQNIIGDNHGFGINLYSSRIEETPEAAHRDFKLDPYTQYANATALGNVMNGNAKSALRSSDAAALVLAENRMSADPKGLFRQSDFVRLGPPLMSMAGTGAVLRNTCKPARPATECPFLEDGYFGRDIIAEMDTQTAGTDCESAALN